jgi:hypothetical protein
MARISAPTMMLLACATMPQGGGAISQAARPAPDRQRVDAPVFESLEDALSIAQFRTWKPGWR